MVKEILEKPFLTNTDISRILGCSSSKASRIRKTIENDLKKQGKRLITNDVPTALFVEVMNLNVKI
jgi:hypothetical protein